MLDDAALFRFAGSKEPDAKDRENAILRYPHRPKPGVRAA
jgi:hypothetical protein